jgi:iron-sulfur cluster repair protein YtfE (RIC family)
MRAVHERLREALQVTRLSVASGDRTAAAGRDLLLYCHGFCTALDGHHRGEDDVLLPVLAERHPALRPTIDKLRQDHSMVGSLLTSLQELVDRDPTAAELDQHLEGLAAIMESHFRFEERTLLPVLDDLELDAAPSAVFGPL